MQAFQVPAFDRPASLTEIDVPPPGPGEAAVALRACGLNFADLLMMKGSYQDTPEPPFTLGLEAAGVVTELGDGAKGFAPGDRVAVFGGSGGLAEAGVFNTAQLIRIPDAMSFEHAAAMQIAYGTSHMALDHCARLQPGETLLVTGAAGGVGLTAVEIGKLMGATVIAQARGQEKLEVAAAAGADHLVDAGEDLRSTVKALGGADVVYDAVGGEVWKAAFRSANPGARLLPVGFAGGEVPQIPANHLLVKNLTVIGFYLGGYMKFRPEAVCRSFETLFAWHGEGRIKPHISHTLPLDRAAEGLDLLRSRKSTGKVVITLGSNS
ncbi:NADPH:quinone oxidoreductase family protein [Leisingera aquimarina]|uniref:NADPH:quinone oxidoreductase family protein n=1 Tax=Leisingera aquimarina TaxID=476529 RepID=UPI000423770F|nr:NADPH:quinone oxidoreductase family protein [Leisingera aquimarina]